MGGFRADTSCDWGQGQWVRRREMGLQLELVMGTGTGDGDKRTEVGMRMGMKMGMGMGMGMQALVPHLANAHGVTHIASPMASGGLPQSMPSVKTRFAPSAR